MASKDLDEQQKVFLARIAEVVSGFQAQHEERAHMTAEDVKEVVRLTLAADDFIFAGGGRPRDLISGQAQLEKRHDALDRNVNKILDVVVGPIATDWAGDPDSDGDRDESKGLMAKTTRLDTHLSNGGVPVKLPISIKTAVWGTAGTVSAAAISATAMILTTLLG